MESVFQSIKDEDQAMTIYNQGFKAGQEHTKPSKDTLDMFDVMKKEILAVKELLTEKLMEMEVAREWTQNMLRDIKIQTEKTNGRVTLLEAIKLRAEGGAAVLKGIWAFMGVFAVAVTFGLFNMYVQLTHLDSTIRQTVREELTR